MMVSLHDAAQKEECPQPTTVRRAGNEQGIDEEEEGKAGHEHHGDP